MMTLLQICMLWLSLTTKVLQSSAAEPIGTGGPSEVREGRDALLTCVVMAPFYNDTIIWKKGPREILSAGMNRVTSDRRISILHEDSPSGQAPTGGDVWVLLIKSVRESDADVYVCEVNSDPVLRSFHHLRVTAISSSENSNNSPSDINNQSTTTATTDSSDANVKSNKGGNSNTNGKKPTDTSYKKTGPKKAVEPEAPPPQFYIDDDDAVESSSNVVETLVHDFRGCCEAANVSQTCMGYCVLHNIIDGTTGTEPELCESDFPSIVQCMADGRNHVACCDRKKVPDLCQDMCRGEYTPFTDLLKSRVSCVAHTLPALQCILDGIRNIPSQPEDIEVESISERALQVSWSPPRKLAATVKYYQINVTSLVSFDQDSLANDSSALISISLSGDLNSTVINNLKPLTMYSVVVTAHNEHGESQPTQRIRAITLDGGGGGGSTKAVPSTAVIPVLPDVRGCCMKNGITHQTCLNKMCDPKLSDFTQVPDLMVCAPWANITFSCLANNVDHTPCCKARGIPEICLSFCSGTVTSINYNKFKCLQYMPEFSSCLFQGYGVLAGPPSRLHATLIDHHYAVLEWSPPKVLTDTVAEYHLFIRKLGFGDEYSVKVEKVSPIILEDLQSGTYYETFVVAVNAHGKGSPSPRLIFQTKAAASISPAFVESGYNMTQCCHASGLLPQCMPLCTYDIKMSELQQLSSTCGFQVGVLAKCAAAGRDHTPCCNRRSVPSECMSLCHGVVPPKGTECLPFAGNILQCLEEGSAMIPGPILELRAISVTNTSISLMWIPAEEDFNETSTKISDYLVQYGKVDNQTIYETILRLDNEMNTTNTDIDLNNLEPNALYRVLVTARGPYGSSLPSSMLLINTSVPVQSRGEIYGAPSSPHSLAVSGHSATSITITWQPPEFSHPHEQITYRIYHKTTTSDMFDVTQTRLLVTRFVNLKPNTQHIIYITAIAGSKGVSSLPSETLVAWTDPALPAHVDPPAIHPTDMIPEGGSMTILCLAMGNPAPTISLYVGGHLVRQDTSRHMVTTIHNISTDMEHVSCYADNGYGIPMQATKKVNISFAPKIQAAGITVASLEEPVDLKCTVRAHPPPKAMFWRDHDGRVPVIQGGNYDMTLFEDAEEKNSYTMTLHINKFSSQDIGDYFCHAQNALGANTRPVSVRMRNTPAVHNIADCCRSQNVSQTCMVACSFYVDIEAVIDLPECIVDFDKLMKCAADGSDHRACCAQNDVPRRCLNWCRGEPIGNVNTCPLSHAKPIIGCFQSNRDLLPGPPQKVVLQVLSHTEVQVRWTEPLKNPLTVLGYKVYWHEVTDNNEATILDTNRSMSTSSTETKETTVRIGELNPNVMYKLVIKAGNNHGASVLTEPVLFTLGDHYVTSASASSSSAGTVAGILAGVLLVVLAVVALVMFQRKKATQKTAANGVAFENPSYLREVNMEHIPSVSGPGSNGNATMATDIRPSAAAAMNAIADHSSIPPPMTMNEVNPTLYEELKLRNEGGGFKRLVS